MIRFSGRGFMTGWAGLGMIGLILITVVLCICCWCFGFIYNRRHPRPRRGESTTEGELPVLIAERNSPKFIQMLSEAHEGERRRSTCYGPNVPSEVINPAIEIALANPVIDADRVCPYPPSPNDPTADHSKYVPMPTPMPML